MDSARVVVPDEAFYLRGAGEIASRLESALEKRERASLALAGGSTPSGIYQALVESSGTKAIEWGRVDFFWSDERWLPPEDPRSNVGMAKRTLLDPLGVVEEAIHAPAPLDSPARAAAAYQEEIARFVPPAAGATASFDLVLLGLGTDGHTASLFPAAAEPEPGRWVVPTLAPEPPRDRISFTFELLEAARAILVLVSGSAKAEIVGRVLVDADPELPASRLPRSSTSWLLDRSAAAGL